MLRTRFFDRSFRVRRREVFDPASAVLARYPAVSRPHALAKRCARLAEAERPNHRSPLSIPPVFRTKYRSGTRASSRRSDGLPRRRRGRQKTRTASEQPRRLVGQPSGRLFDRRLPYSRRPFGQQPPGRTRIAARRTARMKSTAGFRGRRRSGRCTSCGASPHQQHAEHRMMSSRRATADPGQCGIVSPVRGVPRDVLDRIATCHA